MCFGQCAFADNCDKMKFYRSSSPFDRTTVIGYLEYCVLEVYLTNCFCFAYFCGLFLFVNSCWYLETLCDDFEEMYRENDQQAVSGRLNIPEMKRRLIDTIEFHTQIDTYVILRKNTISK